MQVNPRRTAWTQGIAVAMAAAALALVTLARLREPFDADTLAIRVDALQSHASEAAQLASLVRQDRVAPGFVGEHAAQLADDVQRVQDALAGKIAEPALEADRASARRMGATLHARLEAWSADGALAHTRDLGFSPLAQQLDALRHQIKPEG